MVCGKKLFLGAGCDPPQPPPDIGGAGGVWGVGFYRFSGGQLPNFQGKSPGIFPPIPAMADTLKPLWTMR